MPRPKKNKTPQDLISLTLRVDHDRYVWLKTQCAKTLLSNQDILIQALDQYRKTVEEEDRH